MTLAGFFGAYTYLLRGNVFCNAQTGNVVLMGMALGAGKWEEGFYYLIPQTPLWDIPRLESPRTKIPAGSVAVAGEFSAVYPQQSPGGWQLLGTTEIPMWDVDRWQPSLLKPGDSVRFVQVKK